MSTEPQINFVVVCPTKASALDKILAANAHRTGQYAEGYRLGAKEKTQSQRTAVVSLIFKIGRQGLQGYRDGLAGRPWRTPKRGKGAIARSSQRQAERRARIKNTHHEPAP